MKKNIMKLVLISQALMLFFVSTAFAEGTEAAAGFNLKALQGGLASIAALGCALAQGKLVCSMLDAIGRNPSAAGKMNVPFFVGLAFIESLLILILFA